MTNKAIIVNSQGETQAELDARMANLLFEAHNKTMDSIIEYIDTRQLEGRVLQNGELKSDKKTRKKWDLRMACIRTVCAISSTALQLFILGHLLGIFK